MSDTKLNGPSFDSRAYGEWIGSKDALQKNLKDIRAKLSDKNNPPSKEFIVASMQFIKKIRSKKELYSKLGNDVAEDTKTVLKNIDEEIKLCDDIQKQMSDMKRIELKWHSKDEFKDGKKIATTKYYLIPEKEWDNVSYRIMAIKENVSAMNGQTMSQWTTDSFNDIEELDKMLYKAKNNDFNNRIKLDDETSDFIRSKKWSIVWTSDWLSATLWTDWKKGTMKIWTIQKEDSLATNQGAKVWEIKWVKADIGLESSNWRFNLWLLGDFNEIRSDFRLEASYRMLYAGAKLWTYVWIERWSNLEKYVVAQWFKIPNWKILVTWALLDALVKINFDEVNIDKEVRMQQKAVWLDITQWFWKSSVLNEIKWSIVYYDVNWKDLGKIWDIIKDTPEEYDWTQVSWWVRGWSKLLAEFGSTFKITPKLRADASVWYERLDIDSMYDKWREVKNSPTAWAKLTFDITEHDRIFWAHDYSKTTQTSKAWYSHNFWNNIETFVEWTYIQNTMWVKDEQRVVTWVRWSLENFWNMFGWRKQSKNSPLFSDHAQSDKLALGDLDPNSKVSTDQIQIKVPVIFKEHKMYIDKRTLPGTSNIEKNEDWTLKAVNFDTWASNLTTINAVNHPEHAWNFSVTWGKMLRVSNFEKLHAPSTYKTAINEVGWNVTLFEFSTSAGSVELKLSPKSANWVPASLAAQYMSWALTIEQVKDQISLLPAPSVSDLWLTNNPRPTWNWTLINWATAYAVSLDWWPEANIWNVTSYTPWVALNDWVHTLTIRSIKWWVIWTDIKSSSVTVDTLPSSTTLSATKTMNSANITISSTEAWKWYYLMKPATDPVPTDAQVKAWAQIDLVAWNNILNLTWLTENTTYTFYFIAKDNVGTWNFQNTKSSLNITTDIAPDTLEPSVLTFAANPSTPTSISFKAKINENWTWYYVVMPSWSLAPTNAQIKSWIISWKITSWNLLLAANTAVDTNVVWLTWSTWYDVYFLAQDSAGNLQTINNWALNINTLATPDTVPPITNWNINPSDTSALAIINSNEAWTIYYINQLSALPAPSAATLMASWTQIAAIAWNNSVNISWLTQSSNYTLYHITKDSAWNTQTDLSNNPYSTIATPDTIPPMTMTFAIWATTNNTIDFWVKLNENWTWYYAIVHAWSPAPTNAQIMNNSVQWSVSSWQVQLSANIQSNITASWLTWNTAYELYFISKDTAWNLQSNPDIWNFNTLANAPSAAPNWATMTTWTDSWLSNNDGITNNPRPTINWNSVLWATSYEISMNNWTSWTDIWNVTSYTPWSDLADSTYTIQIRWKNITWNWPSATLEITIDTQSNWIPTVTITSITNNSRPTWTWWAVAGAVGYQISTNSWTSWIDIWNSLNYTPESNLADWTHSLSVKSKDVAWNISNASPDATTTIDTIAPMKTWEQFSDLELAWNPWSWTITLDENVANITNATFKLAHNNQAVSWINNVTWVWSSTLTFDYLIPNVWWSSLYIELEVTDIAWNTRTITTNPYVII
ncbi:MAG: hypothetical protein ACD_3C00082G0004 [uncultured bacterium (gcode 4)]|uniref:Uncharacterized protein n=1 Tax=uncultured bacterium (gcode 4) TaxID=1234023 RepID=K2G212_9BACT|nr:MAG: hypothetical protein ACD_3C00082G0004 [uncultured bacterium (gcode 4)]